MEYIYFSLFFFGKNTSTTKSLIFAHTFIIFVYNHMQTHTHTQTYIYNNTYEKKTAFDFLEKKQKQRVGVINNFSSLLLCFVVKFNFF